MTDTHDSQPWIDGVSPEMAERHEDQRSALADDPQITDEWLAATRDVVRCMVGSSRAKHLLMCLSTHVAPRGLPASGEGRALAAWTAYITMAELRHWTAMSPSQIADARATLSAAGLLEWDSLNIGAADEMARYTLCLGAIRIAAARSGGEIERLLEFRRAITRAKATARRARRRAATAGAGATS